ncbi:hypothetical protein [Pimelobacter sp. 30-1]|uniref:hypothetical protein n=1 Tax=Pimelobacter sp. 30-1 TaxID=2004991 RepID=UPI001C04E1FC|nr:hypothetical protein [Pimelobacter sp. 30-1]MBU2697946.1 hypothetical protein [Pimelobacter sp. 30-1]
MLRRFATLAVTLTAAGLALAPSGAPIPTAGAAPAPLGERVAASGNTTVGTTTLYKTVRGVRVAACRYRHDGNGFKTVRFDLDLSRADRLLSQARFQVNVKTARSYRNPWSPWMANGPTYYYYNGQGRGSAWSAYVPLENAMSVQARTDTRYGTSQWGKLVRWTDLAWCRG